MKYLDEYRNEALAQKVVGEIRRVVTRPWVLMEVCGGQTHTIVKYGIDHLLPSEVELVHGPGCPVCVTSLEMIDKAHAIARRPDVSSRRLGTCCVYPVLTATYWYLNRGEPIYASFILRSMLSRSREPIPTRKWSFLRSDSKPLRRVTRWPSGRRTSRESRTSLCWFPMFWFLRPSLQFCSRR